MKPAHVLSAGLLAATACTAAATTVVPLDPLSTDLHTNEPTQPPPALALRLSDLGFAAGQRLLLEVVGDMDNGPGGDTFTLTIGVFSSSNTLLAPSQRSRVPGALLSDAAPFVTAPTFAGNEATDIPEDFAFDVPAGITVTVPVGAQYLFLAKHDQRYFDNSDPDHDYGVRIGLAPPVPEPQTWAMFAAGLALIGRRAWQRRTG